MESSDSFIPMESSESLIPKAQSDRFIPPESSKSYITLTVCSIFGVGNINNVLIYFGELYMKSVL